MLIGGPATMQEHERLLDSKKSAVSPSATAAAAAAAAVKVTTDFSIAAIMNAAANTDANATKRKLSAPYGFKEVISGEYLHLIFCSERCRLKGYRAVKTCIPYLSNGVGIGIETLQKLIKL